MMCRLFCCLFHQNWLRIDKVRAKNIFDGNCDREVTRGCRAIVRGVIKVLFSNNFLVFEPILTRNTPKSLSSYAEDNSRHQTGISIRKSGMNYFFLRYQSLSVANRCPKSRSQRADVFDARQLGHRNLILKSLIIEISAKRLAGVLTYHSSSNPQQP
jgi:hypothetical protein